MADNRPSTQVLGLPAVTFIAVGFTIGAGVFVFTGIVAKMAGPALPLAYLLAVIPVFISMLPIAMLGAALPTLGGNYRYPSRLVSPGLAFTGVWVYLLASFVGQIPLYALSCATYLQLYFTDLPKQSCAALLVTLFFILNVLGLRLAAVVQGLMVVTLIAALLYYALFGLQQVQVSNFQNMFKNGTGSFLLGTALLTFTYFGANGIIELGSEIKNPGKVIPRSLFIAFPIIVLVYLLVSIATVGTIPAARLATSQEPLIAAGSIFLPAAGVAFFVICGALLALTTTLNALFIVGTKSLLAVVHDGLLPRFLGRLHPRWQTPYVLLTLIWLFSLVGVYSGFSLETLASYATLGGMIIFFPVLLSALYLPKRLPQKYQNAPFKLPRPLLRFCVAVGTLMVLFFSTIIFVDLASPLKIALFGLFVLSGIAVFHWRKAALKAQGIKLSRLSNGENWH